jgi:hypothetical protein
MGSSCCYSYIIKKMALINAMDQGATTLRELLAIVPEAA